MSIRDHRVRIYKYLQFKRKNKGLYGSFISQGIRRVCACGFEGLGGDRCEHDEEQDKAAE